MYVRCKDENIFNSANVILFKLNIKVRGDDALKFLIMGAFLVLLFLVFF